VRMIRMPSVRKTSSKVAVNLVSRSQIRKLDWLHALAEFDEEKDVQLLQEHGVDRE
jgi:hypothetical protein